VIPVCIVLTYETVRRVLHGSDDGAAEREEP